MKRQDNRATSQDMCVCVYTHVYERGLREKGRQRVQNEDNVRLQDKANFIFKLIDSKQMVTDQKRNPG